MADEIIKPKGYTSYAIGLATTEIVTAILRSQERILTISTLLDGQYGLTDVCLSIPCVVNEKGVIKTLISDKIAVIFKCDLLYD